jgi:hypothetical protein
VHTNVGANRKEELVTQKDDIVDNRGLIHRDVEEKITLVRVRADLILPHLSEDLVAIAGQTRSVLERKIPDFAHRTVQSKELHPT